MATAMKDEHAKKVYLPTLRFEEGVGGGRGRGVFVGGEVINRLYYFTL